jgi:hypothetical protein
VGYPAWNKNIKANARRNNAYMRTAGSSGKDYVYIPFMSDKGISSILIVGMSNADTSYRLLYQEEYSTFDFNYTDTTKTNARDVFLLFARFEYLVVGHREFNIKDNRLFGLNSRPPTRADVRFTEGSGCESCSAYQMPEFWEICVTYSGPNCNCPADWPECDLCSQCAVTQCWSGWTIGGSDGEGEGWEDGGAWNDDPSAGGGGDSNPNNNWWDESCEEDPSGSGRIEPCDGILGWEPIETMSSTFNPYVADSVIIDTSITNNFQCFDSLLRTVANANMLAQVILNNVFDVQVDVNLKFAIDWSLNSPDSAEAYTDNGNSILNSDTSGVLTYNSTIYFNPWVLSHASKEFLISSIYHEAIHAKIHFDFLRYQMHLIDSNYIKNHYSIFWNMLTGNYSSVNYQHDIMAEGYINILKLYTLQYYNPTAPQNIKDSVSYALAWGGLMDTNKWKTKSDTCNIIAINYAARDTTLTGPFNIQGTNCSTYNNINFSSLYLTNSCH